MCDGIALAKFDIPDALIEMHGLADRIYSRTSAADPEIKFHYRDKQPLLPVWIDGQLQILEWGNRSDKKTRLPQTGWCKSESLESGKWTWMHPQEAWIPASAGLEKGRWYAITEGIRAIVVLDGKAKSHAYMIMQPASHYYQIMTGHDFMPVFINQVIG